MARLKFRISSNRSFLLIAILVVAVAFASHTYLKKAYGTAGVPNIISYQGRLTDSSGSVLGGTGTTYYFKFSIWDSSTILSGNRLWPTSAPGTATSTVTSGVFNVNIGDTANSYPDALDYDFYTNADVYLQVEVSSNGTSFETLSPRQRIGSAGFAINADNVSGQLRVTSSADYTFNATNTGTGRANFSAEGQIQVGNFSSAPTAVGGGSLYYDTVSNNLFLWNAGTSLWNSVGGTTTTINGLSTALYTFIPANSVTISTSSPGVVTFGLSQNLWATSSPQFAGVTSTNLSFTSATGTTLTATSLVSSTNAFFGNATTSNLTISSISTGQCLQTGASGFIVGTGAACGSGTFTTTTINGLSATAYTLATSTSGSAFTIATTSPGTITFNLPYNLNQIGNLATTTNNIIVATGLPTAWASQDASTLLYLPGFITGTSTAFATPLNVSTSLYLPGFITGTSTAFATPLNVSTSLYLPGFITATSSATSKYTTTTVFGLTGNIISATSTANNNWSIATSGQTITWNFPYNLNQITNLATTTGNLIVGTSTPNGWTALGPGSDGP